MRFQPKEETKQEESERSLIQRAQRGDEQAFATLFRLHKKRVYSVCLLMTKDIAEAEDLTQEAFLQVFRSVGSFRCDSAFSTWLYRIAVNTVLMKLRRRKNPRRYLLMSPCRRSRRLYVETSEEQIRGSAERSTGLHCAAPWGNCPRDAVRFSPSTRLKDISIMKSPRCWNVPWAIQNRSCTKRK